MIRQLLTLLGCLLLFGTGMAQGHLEPTGSIQGVHDPVIMEEDGRFYLLSTGSGLPIRCSDDLITWRGCSAVFFGLPSWIREAVPAVTGLWAPDISY
jgi:beta-xylosidase